MAPGFATTVEAVLAEPTPNPALVTLEMTESIFVQDSERALVVMNHLKHIGMVLALDDFGAGYSSLSYLQRFPIDIVKIDQMFVADIGRNPSSRVIVKAIIDLRPPHDRRGRRSRVHSTARRGQRRWRSTARKDPSGLGGRRPEVEGLVDRSDPRRLALSVTAFRCSSRADSETPKSLATLGDRHLALAGHGHHVTAELDRKRSRHDFLSA